MPFISGTTMLKNAWDNGYAVGAFSAHNAESIQAILWAAEAEQAPVMIQVGQRVIHYMGLEPMKVMIDTFAQNTNIPVCIHLDHSRQYNQTMKAIQLGFQSVMFDGSSLPFEDNASITRKVVEAARALGIGSEGEIGKIGGTEDDITVDEEDAMITSVEDAVRFVQETDVDYLAVSIGTAHGIYKNPPKLAFARLQEIAEAVKRPIVLHGGSDVPDEQITKAISLGISKINVDTELRQSFTQGMLDVLLKDREEYHLAVSLGRGREVMQAKVQEKIRLFGSSGKARDYHN
ncbi:ketose-bisphosphate aldolase [Paenibacillus validus]|uniref:Ketose-bisphosphate aldolase n=1 Tax=Paenibacillus validus TaxID=44253 RepID=A0A7X3CUK5_9BACL|nr:MULTISPECIES: ketose-bisphosphate aldolase [Paenibacillus]MED4602122.1 ketose-bisphosphate aldolase [Paenibacillus validus]MED4607423.1 ketose-bisphosphate aldolase [Paenibacillus validus]MUG73975.1 ketose-bisphosphate aldolase [Paenibacillus validus]